MQAADPLARHGAAAAVTVAYSGTLVDLLRSLVSREMVSAAMSDATSLLRRTLCQRSQAVQFQGHIAV